VGLPQSRENENVDDTVLEQPFHVADSWNFSWSQSSECVIMRLGAIMSDNLSHDSRCSSTQFYSQVMAEVGL
jgi:hypothetical protein